MIIAGVAEADEDGAEAFVRLHDAHLPAFAVALSAGVGRPQLRRHHATTADAAVDRERGWGGHCAGRLVAAPRCTRTCREPSYTFRLSLAAPGSRVERKRLAYCDMSSGKAPVIAAP